MVTASGQHTQCLPVTFCLLLVMFRSAQAATEEFTLGIYGPMTSVTQAFAATAMTFDIDFRKNFEPGLVTRFGPPIVTVPNLNRSLRFKVQIGDSSSDTEIGMRTALNMLQGQNGFDAIQGLVGGYHSAISMPVASMATLFKMTQVSWGSTSPKLSNKNTYPFFLRTIPPDSIQGGGMWTFVEHFLIPAITFAYAQDAYGEGLFQTVVDSANNAQQGFRVGGVGILYMPGAGNYDRAEARAKIKLIKSMGSKLVFLAMTSDQGAEFLPVAMEEGLLSQNYQLIGSEALPLKTSPDILPAGYTFFSPVSRGPLFSQWEGQLWSQLTVDDVLSPGVQASYKIDRWETPISAARGRVLENATFQSAAALDMEAPFIFDAAYAFVFAVNEMLNEGTPMQDIKGAALLAKVQGVSFEGISGRVAFDELGNRAASYEIINVQPGAQGGRRVQGGALVERTVAMYSAVTKQITPESGMAFHWMNGVTGFAIPDAYVSCEAGFWKDSLGDSPTRMCYQCEPGTISAGGTVTQCEPCAAGRAANAERGAVRCVDCLAGNFSAESKSTLCSQCPMGRFLSTPRGTACEMCAVGTYAGTLSSTGCQSCSEGKKNPLLYETLSQVEVHGAMQWVPLPGATEERTCGCMQGAYERNGECEECTEGMICPGKGEVLIEEFHFATSADPGSVFHCYGDDRERCPGGAPGTCAEGRVTTSVACTVCEDGMKPGVDGACEECDGGNYAIFALLPVVAFTACVVVYYYGNRQMEANSNIMLGLGVMGGLVVTVMQLFATFDQLMLPWPGGVKSFFHASSFLVVNPGALAYCVDARPTSQYFVRFVLPYAILAAMLVCYATAKLLEFVGFLQTGQRKWERHKVVNSVFTIYQAIFIALTAISAAPFMCHTHPNGEQSLVQYPMVLCGSGDHTALMIMGIVLMVTFVLPFISLQCWANYHILKIRSEPLKSQRHLVQFRFLMYRFRPDVWWWGVVFTVRQTLLAFAPMVEPNDPHMQAVLLVSIIAIYTALVNYHWPWKSGELNLLDSSSMVMILMVVSAVNAFMPASHLRDAHTSMISAMLGFLGFTVFLAMVYGLVQMYNNRCNLDAMFGADENKLKTESAIKALMQDLYCLSEGLRQTPSEELAEALLHMNSYDLRKVCGTVDAFKVSPVIKGILATSTGLPVRLPCLPHSNAAGSQRESTRRLSRRLSAELSLAGTQGASQGQGHADDDGNLSCGPEDSGRDMPLPECRVPVGVSKWRAGL